MKFQNQYLFFLFLLSSEGGKLIKMLAKSEPKLARNSGYQVKLTEKSGKALSKFFSKDVSQSKCHKAWCDVCSLTDSPKPTMCNVKSVVYSATCQLCEKTHSRVSDTRHPGLYIGQTYRTLSERSKEHRLSYRRLEKASFMFKHWVTEHSDIEPPPQVCVQSA